MGKLLKRIALLCMGVAVVTVIYVFATKVEAKDLPPLRDGDIIFYTGTSNQATAIFAASKSLYSHVGIIKIVGPKRYNVVEAIGPVLETPLNRWIDRAVGGRITIKRMEGLTRAQEVSVIGAARRYYGRPYDIHFLFGEDEIYCSELVYYAFLKGIGRTIGKVQHFADLDLDGWAAKKLIEARWRSFPPCIGKAKTQEACTALLKKEKILTPQGLADDPRLKLIFTNYPF